MLRNPISINRLKETKFLSVHNYEYQRSLWNRTPPIPTISKVWRMWKLYLCMGPTGMWNNNNTYRIHRRMNSKREAAYQETALHHIMDKHLGHILHDTALLLPLGNLSFGTTPATVTIPTTRIVELMCIHGTLDRYYCPTTLVWRSFSTLSMFCFTPYSTPSLESFVVRSRIQATSRLLSGVWLRLSTGHSQAYTMNASFGHTQASMYTHCLSVPMSVVDHFFHLPEPYIITSTRVAYELKPVAKL